MSSAYFAVGNRIRRRICRRSRISCSTSRFRDFSRPKTVLSSKAAANLSRSLIAFMNQHRFQHSRERGFSPSIINLI